MKNKKLFAILTLVCFMFTLMPVAAFAAADLYVAEAGNLNDDSVTTTLVEGIDVVVANGSGEYVFWAEDVDGDVVELTAATTQAAIEFDVVGTYYVYAVASGDVSGLDIANKTKAAAVELIKDRCEYVEEALEVKVKKGDVEYTLSATASTANNNVEDYTAATSTAPAEIDIVADNGWTNEGEVEVFLKKADNTAVKGQEIKFTTNSSYVSVEVEDEITNRNGKVVINITASRAGEYKVYANADNAEKLTIVVNAGTTGIDAIKTVAQPTGNVALDTTFKTQTATGGYNGYTGVAFEITSVDGTILDSTLTKDVDYKITIVDAPADSDIDAADLELLYDDQTNNAYVLYAPANGSTFDEEGKYTFKVTLENGDSATATVNVVEFDEPVRMMLTYKSNTVAYGDKAVVKAVLYMDKNGTMLTQAHPDFSDYGVIKYAANGKAVAAVNEATTGRVDDLKGGTITTVGGRDGEELVGTTIQALAINEDLELTATAEITVVNAADGLEYQSTTADIAVNNKLIVNPVDENGNAVSAFVVGTSVPTVYVLSAPANAAYSVDAAVTDVDELTVTFTASAAGEYKLQTVVRTNGAYLSSVDTIVVGGTAGQFKDVVVMSIGANNIVVNSDVKAIAAAPMIQDNRTFVPFRALAEAFGANVEWVEATQSVVAELNGVKVVMVIGANEYTVNGVAKTADVAPFINGASTMVPVRFVAEAFGINVTPIAAADGSIADVMFAK